MKSIASGLFVVLFSSAAFSAPAASFSCSGIDEQSRLPIEFDIDYAAWDTESGYGIEQIMITSIDGRQVNEVYELKDTMLPGCTEEQSVNRLRLMTDANGDSHAEYLRACAGKARYDIKALCRQNY